MLSTLTAPPTPTVPPPTTVVRAAICSTEVACTVTPRLLLLPREARDKAVSVTSVMFIKLGAELKLSLSTETPSPVPAPLMRVPKPSTPALVVLVIKLTNTPPAAPTPPMPKPMAPAKDLMRSLLSAVTATLSVASMMALELTNDEVVVPIWLMDTEPCTPTVPEALMPTATVFTTASLSEWTRTSPVAILPDEVPCTRALTAVLILLTAKAAPTAALPPPAKLPANALMTAVSMAVTSSEPEPPTKVLPTHLAVMLSCKMLVVLEPVTANVPPPPAATPSASIVDKDSAVTCTAPETCKLLLVTSALTILVAASLPAVRPMKLSAKAAPTAAVPPPETVPANESMSEASCAQTSKNDDPVVCVTLLAMALTVEVKLLVVLEPFTAALPAPLPAAATDWMLPSMFASTLTEPVVLRLLLPSLAVTVPAMSLTEIAPPTALAPPPLMTPAKDEMLDV